MKNYIGAKIIQAEFTTLDKYKREKYGEDAQINEGDNKIECYLVVYPPIGNETEPYISMSPKEVFEKAYREIESAEISMIFDAFNCKRAKRVDEETESKKGNE